MRILFDQGVHEMRNIGNLSMAQVAVDRIRNLWPNASLEILTIAPNLSRIYFPDLQPIHPDKGLDQFPGEAILRRIPKSVLLYLFAVREQMWRTLPTLKSGPKQSMKLNSSSGYLESGTNNEFSNDNKDETNSQQNGTNVVQGVNLYIATGGHYMADAVMNEGMRVLDRLEKAIELGIPTALVGQGLGPIDDPILLHRAKEVLPHVGLIFVRENLKASHFLYSLGVAPSRVICTGDDAIELAYKARISSFGMRIGVGMRVATSTEIKDYHLGIVQQVLRKVSDKHRARLLAIPISQTADERDQEFIHQLLGRNNYLGKIQWRFQTPLEVIKRVGGCHVMVTGAYHGAVFALAQGIPAVCLAKSEHYMNKFSGLADQFKVGCQVIDMNENRLQEKLESAIDDAWDSAEEIRPQLLAAAKLQIEQGKAAYQLIYDMVESKKYSTLSMGVE